MKSSLNILLLTASIVLAIAVSFEMSRTLHNYYHRSTVFSPPEPGVSPTQGGQALTDFSSPSSEVASIKSATFTSDDLLDALIYIESRGADSAIGDNGAAVGCLQIHKIYVDDVNRILKLRAPVPIGNVFSYEDRLDRDKSLAMVGIYIGVYGPKAWDELWASGQFKTTDEAIGWMKMFELQARIHNGGPNGHKKESTKAYWLRVKARMEAK
jgi:hypothetical protein